MSTLSITGLEVLLAKIGLETPIPAFSDSDVLNRPIDIYRAYLADLASNVLDCDRDLAYEAVQSANLKDNSDLTLVLPKLKLKSEKPKEIAKECFAKFKSTPLFQLPLPDGVHLRFIFSSAALPQIILPYIDDRLHGFGRDPSLGARDAPTSDATPPKVVVEFSSPNLAKEFTSAHLRSTILGAQLANLYENMGWDVVRLNYLGDWGKEIGLLAVGWARFGSEEMFQKSPMTHLLDVYNEISELFQPEKEASKKARDEKQDTAVIENQGLFAERDRFFKRMEDGEAEAVDFWRRIRDVSIDYYVDAYARLNVKFDDFSGESQVSPESVAEVESILKSKGIYEESEGSWIIDYSKHGPKSIGVSVVRDRNGSTSYLLRDIAAVLDRYKKHAFGKMIYVATSDQDTHFSKVFQALRYMGRDDLADKLEYISFGKIQGLLPQLGKVQLLGDILDQSTSALRDALGAEQGSAFQIGNTESAAGNLGITALVAQDSQHRRATGYNFNTTKLASFEDETGPSLQACYARLCGKISESDPEKLSPATIDYSYLQEDPWIEVLGVMAQYPDVTHSAYKSHEPSLILAYLFRLCEGLVSCLDDEEDDNEDEAGDITELTEPESNDPTPPEAIAAQAVLYQLARQILLNGMTLLGLKPIAA